MLPGFSAGIWVLVAGYTLSQFYRAFIAVLSPVLREEVGASPGDLALSSGLWFIAFAAMQIPVGRWLDRHGPRLTAALLMGIGGGLGAAIFALATQPVHLHIAMALLGVGCSPALMAAYYIFARNVTVRQFGPLAGAFVAFGAIGNILGASPLVALSGAIGWRETMWLLAGVTVAVAVAEWLVVRDPARLDASHPGGSLRELLGLRALWFILPLFAVNYGASAAIRGLWAAPYLEEVFAADAGLIGRATLAMGLAMIAGNFLVGPAVRLVGSVRRTILISTAVVVSVLLALAAFPAQGIGVAVLLLTLVGLSGASYVLLIAHGRAFLPPHLVGRGVTFLNMFSIGGTGVLQFASRPVYAGASAALAPGPAFGVLFLFFAIPLAVGLALYFRTPEAPDA